MSNIAQRLILFFVGVPAVVAIILFLPHLHHLAAVVAIAVFCGGCGLELSRLFAARGIRIPPLLFAASGAIVPAGAYLGGVIAGQPVLYGACAGATAAVGLLVLASFASFAFVDEEGIPDVLPKAGALAFSFLYPGLLGAFIVLIATEPLYSTEALLSFCILAFSSDSGAWLFGVTLGKHRGIVRVSPNKSVEGFAAGILAPTGMIFFCGALFPRALDAPWWKLLVLGLAMGLAVVMGDLVESALKRSAGTKDSGRAVPGRGGFLDSFDSLLYSSPLFFGLSLLLGLFR